MGINAHLHSNLQNRPGGWIGFHNTYIDAVGQAIQAQLDQVYPGRYLVDPTKSIQITEEDDTNRRRNPDATINEIEPATAQTVSAPIPTPTLVLEARETISDPELLTALAIREVTGDASLGDIVAWIEVLSPTNKVGDGLLNYRQKRAETIAADISLVEFDYLHETPSPIDRVPRYPAEEGAFPYLIAINDRRLTDQYGKINIYGCHVDEPIPEIYIPLKGHELIRFDPNPSYNDAFERFPALSYRLDYEREPERFNTYSPTDQERIRRRMRVVGEASQQGTDLDAGPFPAT